MQLSIEQIVGLVVGTGICSFTLYLGIRTLDCLLFKNFDRTVPIPLSLAKIDNEFYNFKWINWWDTEGVMCGLHAMNPTRVDYFARILHKYLDSLDKKAGEQAIFIDIGCGGGLVTEELSRKGFRLIGFDQSSKSISEASKHAEMEGLNTIYKVGNAYDLSNEVEDSSVDGVIMSDVLEHLHDLPRVAAEISRVLKPGGLFVFDTINRTALSFLLAIYLVQESPFGLLPAHTHNWSLFIKPEELEKVLKEEEMELNEVLGLQLRKDSSLIKAAFSKRYVKELSYYIGGTLSVQYVGYATKRK